MRNLLTLPLFVEPDRQRLVRFVLEAVEELGGNVFAASLQITHLLEPLRAACAAASQTVEVRLIIDENKLWLEWESQRMSLTQLLDSPAENLLDRLAERLRLASETSDSELLQMRNRQINEELGRFMEMAAAQMVEMEQVLERRKGELAESIRQAETDALTGLCNRGAYDVRLREALFRCERQHESMCLLLLDLDYFKQVNDTHGHQYGDEYLKKMAESMRAAVRDHVDIPCRMGGDEFAIIVFSDVEIASEIARRVLTGMSDKVSIGIGVLRAGDTVESLVSRADAALYEAKRRGRGQFAMELETSTRAAVA